MLIDHPGEDANVAALMSRLVDETRTLAGAEIALYKARIGERASAFKNAAIFFAVAGVLALAGLVALLVGLILSLATLVGPGFATAIVVVVVFAVAGVLGVVGKGKLAPPKILR